MLHVFLHNGGGYSFWQEELVGHLSVLISGVDFARDRPQRILEFRNKPASERVKKSQKQRTFDMFSQ